VRGSLFDLDVPRGLHYRDDFITTDEEAELAGEMATHEMTLERRSLIIVISHREKSRLGCGDVRTAADSPRGACSHGRRHAFPAPADC
jgi:hypothetical protein